MEKHGNRTWKLLSFAYPSKYINCFLKPLREGVAGRYCSWRGTIDYRNLIMPVKLDVPVIPIHLIAINIDAQGIITANYIVKYLCVVKGLAPNTEELSESECSR